MSTRFSCPRCGTPYMVAALDAEAEGRALDAWCCTCEPPTLPDDRPIDWLTAVAWFAMATACVVFWLALIAWLIGRAT